MTRVSRKLRAGTAKIPLVCVAAALAFIWVGLVLAWGAALVQWLGHVRGNWTGWEAIGVLCALAWAVACGGVLEVAGRHWRDRVFVPVASGMALLVGLSWAWATRDMVHWPADSGLYRWFLERLAEGGFSVDNLHSLAGMYDYPVWTRRALPFWLPLFQWLSPENFTVGAQLVQAAIASIGVVLAWRVSRLVCGRTAARRTVALLVAMPGYAMQVVGLNHQVWGSFWFLAGWWVLTEWMFGEERAMGRVWLVLAACVLVPIVRLAGFAGTMYLLCAATVLLLGSLQGAIRKRSGLLALACLVVFPATVSWAVLHPLSRRMDEANPVPIRGGQLAFAARGWDCRTWGEYMEDGERLDILTPPEKKNRLFLQYLAGQCAYHGPELVTKLFPAKLAKFMLAGYANLAEEVLWANGAERVARMARGMRVGWFLMLYAPLMLLGLWRLSRRAGAGDGRAAWLLLPVALFGVAVMVAGETSPRYSMPVQALLIAAGAWGWACGRQAEGVESEERGVPHPFALGLVLVLATYAVFAGSIVGLRGTWVKFALADMRTAMLDGGMASTEPYQAPFEAVFPAGEGAATWEGSGGEATMYLRGQSWRERVKAEIATRPGEWREVELPMRLEASWEKGEARQMAIRRTGGAGPLHVGYVDVRETGSEKQ